MASSWAPHLHTLLSGSPCNRPAATTQKRANRWWSDNIPDSKRLFPAPSSIRVTSIRLTKRWIYRAKAVGLKAPFEPPPE